MSFCNIVTNHDESLQSCKKGMMGSGNIVDKNNDELKTKARKTKALDNQSAEHIAYTGSPPK